MGISKVLKIVYNYFCNFKPKSGQLNKYYYDDEI